MDINIQVAVITGVFTLAGALGGSFLTALIDYRKNQQSEHSAIALEVRGKKAELYESFLKKINAFSRYMEVQDYHSAEQMAIQINENEGALFLLYASEKVSEKFGTLISSWKAVTKKQADSKDWQEEMDSIQKAETELLAMMRLELSSFC